jgi:hypothetical protein
LGTPVENKKCISIDKKIKMQKNLSNIVFKKCTVPFEKNKLMFICPKLNPRKNINLVCIEAFTK